VIPSAKPIATTQGAKTQRATRLGATRLGATRLGATRLGAERLDAPSPWRAAVRLLLCLWVGLLAIQASAARAQAVPGRRVALVIGNATYTNGGVLDNPEADAETAAAKLTSLGFQVTADKDLGQSGMRDLIGAFMSKVRDGDLVLIYYAGHGIEEDGRDYMLPVDVKLETPTAVQFQGIPLDMLYPDKKTFGVIIIFDACRDNPFLRRVKGAVAGTHALSPPVGDLVLFSASSGDVAEDGGVDVAGGTRKNSVFAVAFANALSVPDASIQKIYQNILREVRTQTSDRQKPQRFGDLADDFTFNTSIRSYAAVAAAPTPVSQSAPPPATQLATAAPAGGAVYRSLPVSEPSAAAAPAASPAATPRAADVRSTASEPAPRQVADLAATPPPIRAAPAPASALPVTEGGFTIASLGQNVMPPPPQLEQVPVLKLPASFCSVEEEIAFLQSQFKPAYDIAYRNNARAIAYLSGLNALGQEYSARQSGFVFAIKSQFEAFAPIAAKVNQTSNETLGIDAKVRQIPIEACATHH
jgi:uncharacterized caspase-like protein